MLNYISEKQYIDSTNIIFDQEIVRRSNIIFVYDMNLMVGIIPGHLVHTKRNSVSLIYSKMNENGKYTNSLPPINISSEYKLHPTTLV